MTHQLGLLNLVLLIGVGVSISAAQQRSLMQYDPQEFPTGCACERSLLRSRYRMGESTYISEPLYEKYCFRIFRVGGCDERNKCCKNPQGVRKAEFEVDTDCKSSLKFVTVNGIPRAYEYNTRKAPAFVRVTNLNLTFEKAPNTEICLLLRKNSTCTRLHQLCGLGVGQCKYALFNWDFKCCPVGITNPVAQQLQAESPPSPPLSPSAPKAPKEPSLNPPHPRVPLAPSTASPPPGAGGRSNLAYYSLAEVAELPKYKCKRMLGNTRIVATYTSTRRVENNLTRICFNVSVRQVCPNPDGDCCRFQLHRLELGAHPNCGASHVYSTIDGVKTQRFFQYTPNAAFKIANINKPFPAIDGTQVCLFMRPPCNNLVTMCGGYTCALSAFSPPGTLPACCPTNYFPVDAP